MDAYGLGVAATLNASTKMVFQSRNLMMRIDYVDQNSPVQTTQLVLYQYNAIRAPSMGRLPGQSNISLGSHEKLQPGFWDEKKGRRPGRRALARNSRNKANMARQKVKTFAPIIALATLLDVSLQSNGMLIMLKIQQAKQDDTIRAAKFIPSSSRLGWIVHMATRWPRPRLEKPRSPDGYRASQPFPMRSRKLGQPGQTGGLMCEEALNKLEMRVLQTLAKLREPFKSDSGERCEVKRSTIN